MLKVQKLSKDFLHPVKVRVLDSISFSLEKGQSLAIMGASGEGKSTLLQLLGSLEEPSSGQIFLDHKKLEPSMRREKIGFIFQSYNLLEDLTSLENILLPALIGRKNTKRGSEIYQRAENLLHQVGLEDRKHFPAKLLSGGEKQRIAIARALCNQPSLVLADEPSGNLDHQNSERIHKLLLSCTKQSALIIATHDKELAKLCTKCYRLENAQLQALTGNF